MKRAATLFLFLIASAVFACAQPGNHPEWVSVAIPGAIQTEVWDINSDGAMVGQYEDSSSLDHGFAIVGNQVFTIDVPGMEFSHCRGINSAGVIVGFYSCWGCSFTRGFLYQNGTFTEIGSPDGTNKNVVVTGINDNGQIVGYFGKEQINGLLVTHGFVTDGKAFQQIDVPNAAYGTKAMSINNSGVIALRWIDANVQSHSSLYDGSNFKNIDVPGSSGTLASSINNLGDVLVTWYDQRWAYYTAVLKDGTYTTLSFPGRKKYQQANSINDHEILGGFTDWYNSETGYKLIP